MLNVTFLNGNALRVLFQNMYCTVSSINIRCQKDSMTIQQHNVTNQILHSIKFNLDTIGYNYHQREEFIVGLGLSDLIKAMKIVSRRDTLILEVSDPTASLKISTIGNNGAQNETQIRPKDVEIVYYDMPELTNTSEVISILSIEMSKQIVSLLATKPIQIEMKLFRKGIIFQSDNVVQKIITFGEPKGNYDTYTLDHNLLKSLSKIPALSYNRSVVKIYKLEGCCAFKIPFILGEYTLYVRQ